MKKTLFLFPALLGICAMVALSSFKPLEKNQVTKLETIKNVTGIYSETYDFRLTTANNILVFPTAELYYRAVNNPDESTKNALIDQVARQTDFTRIEEGSGLYNLIDDDYFRSLLNNNGCLQVGNYIYKINPTNEAVYVLNVSRIGSLADLINEDITNTDILQYSTEDFVIGMVESNTPPSNAKIFCSESGCAGDSKPGTVGLTNAQDGSECGSMDAEVFYKRYGIYFHLASKVRIFCTVRTIELHITPAAYKVKCGYSYGPMYKWNDPVSGSSNGGWMRKQFYQNVQPLNAFWVRVVYMAKDAFWNGNPDNPSIDLEIRKNM